MRDQDTGDFWSASWRPVEKPLDLFCTRTRHGLSYTQIDSKYSGIESEALYYIPQDSLHEVWRLKLKNCSDTVRNIGIYGYCEFTTESFYTQDLVNMQYTQFITVTEFRYDHILQRINQFCGVNEQGENGKERFFGLAGSPVASYTGRRENPIPRFELNYRYSSNYESGGAGLISDVRDCILFADSIACGGKNAEGTGILSPEMIQLWSSNQLGPVSRKSFDSWNRKGYSYALGVRTRVDLSAGGRGSAGSIIMEDVK